MFILIIILTCFNFLYADYGGGYAGSSMRIGYSAREIALSNSMVAVSNPGFNAFLNPAFLSNTKGLEFGNSLFLLSQDRNLQVFSVSRELPPSGGAGISVFRAGINNILGISSSEENLGNLGYNDLFAMLSFGVSLNKYLSVGFNIKSLFQNFKISNNQKYSSKGIAFDFGFYSIPIKGISLGCKIENLSGRYSWNQDISDNSQDYEENIPTRILLGGSYSFNDMLLLAIQHEMISASSFNSMRTSAAIEYKFNYYKTPIFFRFGLKQNQWAVIDGDRTSFPFILSPGIGFYELKFMNNIKLNIDYAIQYTNLGINNYFSISTRL